MSLTPIPPITGLPLTPTPTSSSVSSSPTSASGTPTLSSSSAPSPSATMALAFNTVSAQTMCDSTTITWNYTGSADAGLELNVVTGMDLRQNLPAATPDTFVNQTLATGLSPASQSYVWDPVNVPAGWYKIEALLGPASAESSSFFVSNGTDASCSATTTGSSGLTASQRAGAIAGGVIGGVLVIAAAVLALLFLRRRRSPTRARGRSAGAADAPQAAGKWTGLGSRDAALEVGLPISKGAAGRMELQKTSYESTSQAACSSEGDASTLNEDEAPVRSRRSEYVETVPPMPYDDHRSSSSTLAESQRGSFRAPHPHRASRRSVDIAAYPLSAVAADGAVSSPISPDSPSLQRSASGAGRRPTRKPVPTYAGGDAVPTASPISPASPVYASDSPARSREHVVPAGVELPTLGHKASFGDMRPMHVLIPDMPPPQREL